MIHQDPKTGALTDLSDSALHRAEAIARCYLAAPDGSEEEDLLEHALERACGSAGVETDVLIERVNLEPAFASARKSDEQTRRELDATTAKTIAGIDEACWAFYRSIQAALSVPLIDAERALRNEIKRDAAYVRLTQNEARAILRRLEEGR